MRDWIVGAWERVFGMLSLALLGLVLLVAWAVLARNADLADVAYVEDICQLIQLWVGVLFIAAVQRDEGHIAGQFLHPRSMFGRRALAGLRHGAFLLIGLAWIWIGTLITIREAGMVGVGGLQVPLPFVNAVIPVAGSLIAINAVLGLVFLGRASKEANENAATVNMIASDGE